MINRRGWLGAVTLSALTGSACARTPDEPRRPGRDGALDAARQAARVPGMAAVLVNGDGVVWSGVSGVRRQGSADGVSPHDRWHLGSNTKAMTALVFARLVDGGQTRWEATLPELFPDLRIDPGLARVTAADLAAHRSGLADGLVMGRAWLANARDDRRALTEQRTALTSGALAAPPDGDIGQFAYANLNYVVLGSAIERLAERPWETVLRENLFQPLGLGSAGFGAPPSPSPWGHRSLVGLLLPVDPTSGASDNPPALGPAGTAHMNLDDYGRWLRVFLGRAPDGFISPEALARLTAAPDPSADYALGWGLSRRGWTGGGIGLAHEGSNTLWRVAALIAPERGLACAVAANRDTQACARLARDLISAG